MPSKNWACLKWLSVFLLYTQESVLRHLREKASPPRNSSAATLSILIAMASNNTFSDHILIDRSDQALTFATKQSYYTAIFGFKVEFHQ